MIRSSYHQIARLATHPAWSTRSGGLLCQLCLPSEAKSFVRVVWYDRHFLAHLPEPSAEQAWRWLSGRSYEREQVRRGWPTFDEMLNREPANQAERTER